MKFFIFIASIVIVAVITYFPSAHSEVLVFKGKGVCEGCDSTLFDLTRLMGLDSSYIRLSEVTEQKLSNIKVWIQPGGDAIKLAKVFSDEKKQLLREFVANGGSYVGICAGAFFADTTVDDNGILKGLGFLPGETYDYLKTKNSTTLKVDWLGEVREVYYQAGPAFKLNSENPMVSDIQVLSRYQDGSIAALKFRYGKGKVVLVGPHPEATMNWYVESLLPIPEKYNDDLLWPLLQWATE